MTYEDVPEKLRETLFTVCESNTAGLSKAAMDAERETAKYLFLVNAGAVTAFIAKTPSDAAAYKFSMCLFGLGIISAVIMHGLLARRIRNVANQMVDAHHNFLFEGGKIDAYRIPWPKWEKLLIYFSAGFSFIFFLAGFVCAAVVALGLRRP